MTPFDRCIEFVLLWEGGYQCDPNDPGNWTGGKKGEGLLLGTKYGISAAAYGHERTIKDLTEDEARDIYRIDYWQAAGCDKLEWPLNLCVLDAAVNCGVGRAKKFLEESFNWCDYLMWRIKCYIDSPREDLDDGWINRIVQRDEKKPGLYKFITDQEHPLTEEK